ncbi:substrate-binding domain-containing protein [Cellulomonas timonensis]|uniref:substrate-binding domain-containing protein n=1 Tax=Cellulomonas timonensis TaxID=1689271 RepID=UPI001F16F83D|nr:substrate-binding domain-containing protein [Cellulomonas timonensis]
MLSPVVGGFYFGGLIAGVVRAARNAGHRVVAVQTYPAGLDRERYPDEPLLEVPVALGAVDGIVVIAKAVRHDRLASVQGWGRPLVLISEDETSMPVPVVVPDNAGGVRAAVTHLIEHGHTKIGFVGNVMQRDLRERYAAYRETLTEHGIEPRPEWFFDTADNHEQGGADAAGRFLAAGSPTTAMFAVTDRNAIGFTRTLRASGLVLPRDQAVIGFDHTDSGARLSPRLSTVDPHHDRLGELAVALLLAKMRGEEVEPAVHRTPATLLTRESCGCGETAAVAPEEAAAPHLGASAARNRLRLLADVAFGGSPVSGSGRRPTDDARTTWCHGVLDPLLAAAERGAIPTPTTLTRLADLSSALQPHPEALEQLVGVVRDLEAETLDALAPDSPHPAAVRRVATELLLALTKGCVRPLLARSGSLERTIADQYEVDMDLLRGKGASPRALTWLPRAVRGPACLGLWVGRERAPGDREVEIVGVYDTSGTLTRLIGSRSPASQFPPPALTRSSGVGGSDRPFYTTDAAGDLPRRPRASSPRPP